MTTPKLSPPAFSASMIKNRFFGAFKKIVTPNTIVFLLETYSSYYIALHNQFSIIHSFNFIDAVVVTVNNGRQELQNLFKSVQHHTIIDVFFCLSFASLPLMGELRLALAVVRLWWGGGGNKPFIRRILPAVDLTVLNLPAALILGRIIKVLLPVRKV